MNPDSILGRMRNAFRAPGESTPMNDKETPLGDTPGTPVDDFAGDPWRERFLRTAAELDNVLKRSRRDVDRARRQERAKVLCGFLEVLDNFERALALQGAEGNEWIAGIEATRQQMLEVFRSFGATPFDALGEAFDPMRHEAIATARIPGKAEGIVVEVIQTGYLLDGEETIRAAKVVVAM